MEEEKKEIKKRGRKPKAESVLDGEGIRDTVEGEGAVERKKTGKKAKAEKGVGVNGNLIPFDRRTEKEQREICSKAGVASGAARRRKKELREFTRDFLMQDATGQLKANMQMLGVDAEQMSNLAAMVVRLFSKAVNQGDLNAARTIIEWAGMAPLQQEKENEAIAKMAQVMQLASVSESGESESDEDVVFYIPVNGRDVAKEEDFVEVK